MIGGFFHEIVYWDRELSLKGHYPDAIRKRVSPERMAEEFPDYLSSYFEELRVAAHPQKPKVLDVGSGPLSMLAFGHRTGMFDLTCVDPLGEQYLALLAKYGHPPNAPIVEGFGEDLASLFPEGTFAMAWMHNAMDHSQSPAKVLQAMTRVVRRGGYIVILGWCREGTAEGWKGLHQYDLYLEPHGRLMCKSRRRRPVCISQGLPLKAVDVFEETTVRDWMRVIYRRTG